jgi:Peptidase inhibitor I78 family
MRKAVLFLTLGLAACQTPAPPSPDRLPPEPAPNECGAGGMQDLMGKHRSVFAAMTLPRGTRIIEPGMAITEDYGPTRLNIDLAKDGRITRVWCG